MALVITRKYEVSIDAQSFIVTDITGAYDVTTNPNGWGAPNAELNQSAVWAIVKLKHSSGDKFFEPVNSQIVYDPAAVNTKETGIEFKFKNDGVMEITMGMLEVSTDGINLVSTAAPIPEGSYFYWSNAGVVLWKMVSGVPVEVEDINELLDNSLTVLQTTDADILMPRLAVTKQKLYKKYRLARIDSCDDEEDLFKELNRLGQDIQGAIYAFYSTLTVEAQDQIESLLDLYDLNDQ